MSLFASLQAGIFLLISFAIFIAAVWALINALRFPPGAYTAAGKRTKGFWTGITIGAAVCAFLNLPPAMGFGFGFFFMIAASVASLVFLVDVLPRLREHHQPGYGGGQNRGGW